MSFRSGRVTYMRFRVEGDSPQRVDEGLLNTLKEHAFQEGGIGAPDETECGWVTGDHVLDTQFTYEKSGFGLPGEEMLLFAMRMDTHKVPADVKKAYKQIHEEAALAVSQTGFLSKAEKREVKELTERQIHDELAEGKYRKSKMVPLLWDLKKGLLYIGATGASVTDEVAKLFKMTFAVMVKPLTSGILTGDLLSDKGRSRDYEDLLPSRFMAPPPEASIMGDEINEHASANSDDITIPLVPWVTKSVDMKDYCGNEFMIWLWWMLEKSEGEIKVGDKHFEYTIDKQIDLQCAWDARGKVTQRGTGPTRQPEARHALATGKWPRKAGLMLVNEDGMAFELNLQADRLEIGSALLPMPADEDEQQQLSDNQRQMMEHRVAMVRRLDEALDELFEAFVELRASSDWSTCMQSIQEWIIHEVKPSKKKPVTPEAPETRQTAPTSAPTIEVGEIPADVKPAEVELEAGSQIAEVTEADSTPDTPASEAELAQAG